MHLHEVQKEVDQWITNHGVRYFAPLTNLGILMEEVGELARIIVRTHGEQSFKTSDLDKNLSDEMADVLWVLSALANQCGVDLETALRENIQKKTERDVARHKQNPKLNNPD